MSLAALILAAIAFVPLDDRPVTRQLPQMLGAIAGRQVIEPPRNLLGNYLVFGRPDAIIKWLNASAPRRPAAFVISSDMLAYGGLVASRVPGVGYTDARFRLNEFRQLRRRYPQTWIGSFGTIMRLAPTGVPALGPAASFFAAYPLWQYVQDYANLHDPPLPSEQMRAAHLRELSGATLQSYLETRARNWAVDMYALDLTQADSISDLVLGQDDAGPVGLHVKEVAALQARVQQDQLSGRVTIEPGADELGMALVARALARGIHWTPRISVRYSTPDGAAYNDPLEYSPIDTAIGGLVALCGGERVDSASDIDLYVRVPHTGAQLDAQLLRAIEADEAVHKSVALADLTFLEDTYADQAHFAAQLLASGAATNLDAYSSWNTNANTVGTALAEAVAAGVGRRAGTYNALAHKEFTFNRFVDDYLFHDEVRPQLNTLLDRQGVSDHTYLLPAQAAAAQTFNRAALWNGAAALLPQLYPGYHIAAMDITLPWNRTFETEIDASLAPGVVR
ncbi:MAG TPA: DUF4127 family protein [Candidatus Baltobacteraceae bacterium]|nr:DUF4127 family protein [Candidatus Baltobacteraceae bacterium]